MSQGFYKGYRCICAKILCGDVMTQTEQLAPRLWMIVDESYSVY